MSINYVGNVQSIQTPISTTDYTNLIINGGMDIDQRNEGASTASIYVPVNTTVNQYGTDRNIWSVSKQASGANGITDCIITERRALTSLTAPIPTEMGSLKNALRFEFSVNTGGYGGTDIFRGIGSGKEVYFSQLIENTIYGGLEWGKSTGKSITLSFWFMTETNNNITNRPFNIFVKNQADTHVYRATVLSAPKNVWRKAIISIPPPPVGSDWTGYMRVGICMFDRTATSTLDNEWDSTSLSYGLVGTDGYVAATDMFLTGADFGENAYFHITGLQVQEGGATPFEYRPLFNEIKLCERYYEKSYSQGVVAGTITNQNCVMLS